jgi:hypothetical protein
MFCGHQNNFTRKVLTVNSSMRVKNARRYQGELRSLGKGKVVTVLN